jgi:hypothetical protein
MVNENNLKRPSVTTYTVSGIMTNGATLNGHLSDKGSAYTILVSFEYGLTTSYGSSVSGVPATLTHSGTFTASITDLTPNTQYHYRAKAVGDGTVYGSDQTFTTLPGLVVDNGKSGAISRLPIEIALINVNLNYDNKTKKLVSTDIIFWISDPKILEVSKPTLKVGLDGKILEETNNISVDQSTEESIKVIRDFVPSQGWKTGTYSFCLELIDPDSVLFTTNELKLFIESKKAAIINWSIFLVITSIAFIASIILGFALAYRKRYMYNT